MANNIRNSITITGSRESLEKYDKLEELIKDFIEELSNNEAEAIVRAIYQRSIDDIEDLTDLIGSNRVNLYDDIDNSFEIGNGERTIHLMSAWAPVNPIVLEIFNKIHCKGQILSIVNSWVDEDDPIQRGEYKVKSSEAGNNITISESFIDLNEISFLLQKEIDSYELDYDNDETCKIEDGELIIGEEALIGLLEKTETTEELDSNKDA